MNEIPSIDLIIFLNTRKNQKRILDRLQLTSYIIGKIFYFSFFKTKLRMNKFFFSLIFIIRYRIISQSVESRDTLHIKISYFICKV